MTEPKLRPKGMGLGAEAAHLNKDVAPKNSSATNEEREDLVFKIGAHAVITKGSKKGYYGQVIGIFVEQIFIANTDMINR